MMMMSTFIVNIWQLRQNDMITSVAVNYMKGIFCKKETTYVYIWRQDGKFSSINNL